MGKTTTTTLCITTLLLLLLASSRVLARPGPAFHDVTPIENQRTLRGGQKLPPKPSAENLETPVISPGGGALVMVILGCNPRLFSLLNSSTWHLNVRAFSSSSSSPYSSQSRGGLPRFFSETLPTSKGGVVRVKGDEFWHMTKVLRLGIDDRVELFNGKGGLVEGRIESIDRSGVDFEALENPTLVSPPTTQWHIFAAFSTLKGGRADWLVEKCTELGASSVTPLLTVRSQSISENRVDRLQRVIMAAAKQCQRLHEMLLKPPIAVGELLPVVAKSRLAFVAAAESTPVFIALSSLNKEPNGIIIIGPEGDFTEKELNSLTEAGAIAVGLGPHRLRVETATMAVLSTLMLWSDSQELASN